MPVLLFEIEETLHYFMVQLNKFAVVKDKKVLVISERGIERERDRLL